MGPRFKIGDVVVATNSAAKINQKFEIKFIEQADGGYTYSHLTKEELEKMWELGKAFEIGVWESPDNPHLLSQEIWDSPLFKALQEL